ncbi:MAG: CBS domain-containing protein [Chromatiales bacterium]|nr:CBS domain-containing protein [Chromatiales bacterium]
MSDKKLVRVGDVMKSKVDMIDGMTTVAEALKEMKHIETKTLIINKRNEDDEYGMLLISDISKSVLATDRSPERINVYEIMSKPVLTVHPEMDIRYCARLFDRFGLSRAPVLDAQHNIVGVVSHTDMVLKGLTPELG